MRNLRFDLTKVYLACLLLALSFSLAAQDNTAADIILLPPPPVVKPPPPSRGERGAAEDLQRKRQHLRGVIKDTSPPAQTLEDVQREQLLEEAIKPRPFVFSLHASFLLPTLVVSGPREGYVLEPGQALHASYRVNAEKPIDQWNLWLGLRGAFFSGHGVYDGAAGQFSFLYWGPSFAVGRFNSSVRSLPASAYKSDAAAEEFLESVSGWLVAGGIAAQSRFARTDRSAPETDDDMNSVAVAFDSPGVWLELEYHRVSYGALGHKLVLGVQTGKGKIFPYIGFGVGGFY